MNRAEGISRQLNNKKYRRKRESLFDKLKGDKKKRTTARSYSPPPVVARTSSTVQAFGTTRSARRSKRSRSKRRFDFTLGTPGAEMQLSSIPSIRIGWRFLSLMLTIVFGFLLYMFWTNSMFQINDIKVSELQRISPNSVRKVVGVTGERIFAVNTSAVREELVNAFPEFSNVNVSVALPNTVFITVTERLPVLVWSQNGRSEFVDENGEAFPIRLNASDIENYPVVEASSDPPSVRDQESDIQSELDALGIAGLLPTDEVVFSNKAKELLSPEMVQAITFLASNTPSGATIAYDDVHGLSWHLKSGLEVYFGEPQEMEEKLLMYHSIREYIKEQGEKPAMISVEFIHAPYYRLR